MTRLFKLTAAAKDLLSCKIGGSNEVFIPTQILVDGTAKEGYELTYVGDDLCGFRLLDSRVRSLYAVKSIISQLNEGKKTDFEKHMTVGTFAWASHALYSSSLNATLTFVEFIH